MTEKAFRILLPVSVYLVAVTDMLGASEPDHVFIFQPGICEPLGERTLGKPGFARQGKLSDVDDFLNIVLEKQGNERVDVESLIADRKNLHQTSLWVLAV
jgi:hypothetical protein